MNPRQWTMAELVELVRGTTVVGRDLHARPVTLPPALLEVAEAEPSTWIEQIGQEHPSDHGPIVANWHRAIEQPGTVQTVAAKRRHGERWFATEVNALCLTHQPDLGCVLSFARRGDEIDPPDDTRADDAATFVASRSIVQHLDEIGLIVQSDGDVEYVFGMTPAELEGRAVTDHLHPDDLDAAIGMWIELLGSPGNTRTIEQRVVRPDGSVVWIQSIVMNRLEHEGIMLSVSHDIGAQRSQHAALQTSEQALRFLTETVPVAVFRASGSGNLTFANARWENLLGNVDSLREVLDLIDEVDRPLLSKACIEARSGTSTTVARVGTRDERHLEFRLQGVRNTDDVDDEVGIIGTVDDVTSAVMRTFHLEATAERDHLTGLANRRGLIRKLESAVAAGGRTLVLFGDLDGFKQVNDAWGHGVGDRVLTAIGNRLRTAVRPGDLVGRWGGDEFVVICDDVPTGSESEVIERLHDSLVECIVTDGREYIASISLGAVRPMPRERGEDVLRRADNAMYESKRAHR